MLNETWLAVKFKASKQQLQDVLDFKVKMIFGSPHAILNNHRHIFRRPKSNLKCFSIDEGHCIERWSSHATNSARLLLRVSSPVHVLFTDLVPPFLASMDPRWFEAFPYFKNLPNYGFIFGTKCLSKVNLRHCIYKLISFPMINSRFKQALVFFWPPDIVNFCSKSLLVITLVQSKQI